MAIFSLKLEALHSSEMFTNSNVQEVCVVQLTQWTELFVHNQAAQRIRHLEWNYKAQISCLEKPIAVPSLQPDESSQQL